MSKWMLVNVVIYDGVDAFVNKRIVPYSEDKGTYTDEAVKDLAIYYFDYGMEVLKIDTLYTLTFENIMAFNNCGDRKLEDAFRAWTRMYF